MTDKIVSVILFIVGIINLLPVVAFFDIGQTLKLYGVSVENESLTVLMRHRGVLLALVGIALIVSAFKSDYRILAVSLALISKFAFIFLTFTSSNFTPEVKQVALLDVGAIVLLTVALGIHFYNKT